MRESDLKDSALVILGHGTDQNAGSEAPVFQHAGELRRRNLFGDVREAFWKQDPQILKVVPAISARRTFIVPLFVSEGFFSNVVIPRALGLSDQSTVATSQSAVCYCRPIGTHDSMTQVLLARASAIIEQFPFPRAPRPEDITLFIAGHGTEKNENSRKPVEHQGGLIRKLNRYAAVHAIFLDEAPRIPDCYQLARTKNIIVVPFFISDGLHVREDIPVLLGEPERIIVQRTAAGQAPWRNPTEKNGRRVWYTPAIGSEPHIADVILERVLEFPDATPPVGMI